MLKHFMEKDVTNILARGGAQLYFPNVEEASVWDQPRGAARGYCPEHHIRSIRASWRVSNKKHAREQCVNSMRFFYPKTWRARLGEAEVKGKDMPHATTIRRSIVQLDIAWMLWQRARSKASGPAYRYISFDASPQHGHELFATVERSATRAELQKASSAQPAVDERMLPISVLGTGRMGLAEKTQAYIHQVWLEYGPAVDDVRQANRNVRTILSDMGVEFSIGDVKDVVRGCLGQPGPAAQCLRQQWASQGQQCLRQQKPR